jgi:hypothetical protein
MPEVVEMLRALPRSVTPAPAGADDIAADLARGHRALARRRRQRLAGLAGGVAVVAGVAVAFTLPGQPGRSAAPATASAAAGAHPAIQLVAYSGAQPAGFTVGTVPAGWQVVSSDAYSFVVAPPATSAAPSADGQGVSFIGRIAVMLQGDTTLAPDATVTAVTVNGQPGKLTVNADSDPRLSSVELFYPDAHGHQVQVQVPASLGLSNAQIVRFAAGITVNSAAKAGLG